MAKKTVTKKNMAEANAIKKSIKRSFPRNTLEDALRVAIKLKELNAGNPWATADVAKAVGLSATSNAFFYLSAASRDYGLTLGTRDTEKIELTELGREVAYAASPTAELQAKKQAFLNIDVFKKVLEYYKGNSLPEMKYLGNTLEKEFSLSPDTHEEFSELFTENCNYLNIKSGNVNSTLNPSGRNEGSTIVVGEPKGEGAPKLFVIMPFVERQKEHRTGFFDEVLRSLIIPAAIEAGFHVETANRQGSDVIHSTIINDLLDADLVLADLTEHNPNVLFELGVRMAKNKPIVLIKTTETGRIFDIDNLLRVYEYNSCLWKTTIAVDIQKIKEHVDSAWKNRNSEQTYMKILLRGTPND